MSQDYNDCCARESTLLDEWGIYIRAETAPGPGEKQDPVSGEWGTKPQALAGMINSGRDEDDDVRLSVENVDRCQVVLEFVRMQHPKHIAVLFGWFCEYPYMTDICLANVQSEPLIDGRKRFKNDCDFFDRLNEAIGHVERSYANMLAASV